MLEFIDCQTHRMKRGIGIVKAISSRDTHGQRGMSVFSGVARYGNR